MDPARKRRVRLVMLLGAAVLLASALVYTSFNASTEAKQPSEVVNADGDRSYELTGKVVDGSIQRGDDQLRFEIRDRDGTASVPVVYTGAVPDPFRDGREVIVEGRMKDGRFVAERDSLVTKCPSKFTKESET